MVAAGGAGGAAGGGAAAGGKEGEWSLETGTGTGAEEVQDGRGVRRCWPGRVVDDNEEEEEDVEGEDVVVVTAVLR